MAPGARQTWSNSGCVVKPGKELGSRREVTAGSERATCLWKIRLSVKAAGKEQDTVRFR
jgi:hypothetical protein